MLLAESKSVLTDVGSLKRKLQELVHNGKPRFESVLAPIHAHGRSTLLIDYSFSER